MSGVLFLLPGTTVDDVAAAVEQRLAATLDRLDVAVSSRATPADVSVTATVAPPARAEVGP